ncbi:Transcription termination factor Rho [Geodia barretti]|uniref:Transcription termination factor Rho n=1 Tax=Geodia barretti TaxID=519541 RepID=A0AA35WJZ8_GEOBA|nr:Transcription termination factor Rho [Geodia barretti]
MTNAELMVEARTIGLVDIPQRRTELALQILLANSEATGIAIGAGILDVHDKGYGFLRPPGGASSDDDIYVPNGLLRKSGMRQGDFIVGPVRLVNGRDIEFARRRPRFEQLTVGHPDKQLTLETAPNKLNSRVIDIIAPIGKGQRALIVAPPKAGKTVI